MSIPEPEPEAIPWSYTIGLTERGHPEVVTLGLPQVHAVSVLNWVHDQDVAGHRLEVEEVRRFKGVAVQLLPVPTAWVTSEDDPLGQWRAHYSVGRERLPPPPVLQLLWADGKGRLPGQAGCQWEVDQLQPRLMEHPSWRPGSPHPASRKGLHRVR